MLSSIIYGKRGSDFEKVTTPLVRKALCTGSLESSNTCECYSCSLQLDAHPDLRVFDKDSYLVEDVDAIVAFAESAPLISNKRVVLIKNLSSITEISQNKLLKELEDNKTFVLIGTADSGSGGVLPTIKSRTEAMYIGSETLEEFLEKSSENTILLYSMTGGYSGLVSEMKEQIPIYQSVERAFLNRSKKELFDALNLVVDKDKECYYEKYKDYLSNLFDFMGDLSVRSSDLTYAIRLLEIVNKEKANSLNSWYARVNFFNSIANIGEVL